MAPTKKELLDQAKASGLVSADAEEDAYKASELEQLLSPDRPAWKGSASATEPIVAPDGHVVLSQEDIDARQ